MTLGAEKESPFAQRTKRRRPSSPSTHWPIVLCLRSRLSILSLSHQLPSPLPVYESWRTGVKSKNPRNHVDAVCQLPHIGSLPSMPQGRDLSAVHPYFVYRMPFQHMHCRCISSSKGWRCSCQGTLIRRGRPEWSHWRIPRLGRPVLCLSKEAETDEEEPAGSASGREA